VTEQEVRDRVEKLIAIHDKHPHTHEGKNALRHALRLIEKHKLNQQKSVSTGPNPLAGLVNALRELTKKPDRNAKVDFGELERRLSKLLRKK